MYPQRSVCGDGFQRRCLIIKLKWHLYVDDCLHTCMYVCMYMTHEYSFTQLTGNKFVNVNENRIHIYIYILYINIKILFLYMCVCTYACMNSLLLCFFCSPFSQFVLHNTSATYIDI